WIGWHMQHWPHWFHWATAFGTLALELALVWTMFLPRWFRIVCFCILTPWQIGIILSANYTFLNYLVLMLGFLLLDDKLLTRFVPQWWKSKFALEEEVRSEKDSPETLAAVENSSLDEVGRPKARAYKPALAKQWAMLKLAVTAVMLTWIFYATTA